MITELVSAALALAFAFVGHTHAADPLPSWNDAAPKQAIIATFDNDGTPDTRQIQVLPRSDSLP